MKKRWRRTGRVLVALLLAVCSLSVNLSPVLAVTQADIDALKDDAGDLSAQRKELEKKLDALADDKSSAMERKNLLDQQIANTSAQISNVEAQISKYASLISEKEQELAEAGGEGTRGEVVKQLDGMIIRGQQVVAKQLPCVFGEALTVLKAALETYQPRLTIAVGQAGGRVDITVERVAINVDDARIPDNKGQQPIDEPIVANGPAACFSTLPIKAIVSALRQQGIPASVSQTAGTFVCNHVMYGLLHQLQGKSGQKGGFIHIPYLPEQAAAHPGQASMSVATVRAALETAIAVALEQNDDVKIGGGATH